MITGLSLSVAAVAMLAGIAAGRTAPRGWLGVTLVGLSAAFAAALGVLAGGRAWEWRNGFTVGGEALHLRLDGISALFLALLCVVGGAASVYAGEYWPDKEHPRSAPRGRVWWSVMLLSLGMVLLASNGLHFLIAWEFFTLAAYFLVTLDRRRPEVRAAGWLYLAPPMRPRLRCSRFSRCWRPAPGLGISARCAIGRISRRCSGWRCSDSG